MRVNIDEIGDDDNVLVSCHVSGCGRATVNGSRV